MNISMRDRGTTIAPPPTSSARDRMDADDVVHLMQRHVWTMLLVIVTITGGTLFWLSRQPAVFSAISEMELINDEVQMSPVNPQLGTVDLTSSRVSTKLDILRSRNFAAAVAEALDLFADPAFVAAGTPDAERRQTVIDHLLASYAGDRKGDSQVISVVAQASTPTLAADIANQVVSTFIERSLKQRGESLDSELTYLRAQVSILGDALSAQEAELAEFIRENHLDDTGRPDKLRLSRASDAAILEEMQRKGGNAARIASLQASIAAADFELDERARNDLSLIRMKRAIDLESTRYETTVERLSDLEPRRRMLEADARQVSVADVPQLASWPNIPATGALAFAGSLVLAFVIALIRDGLDRRIHEGGQATRVADLPNLGSLPRIRRRGLFSSGHDPLWFLRSFERSSFAEALASLFAVWSSQERRVETPFLLITSASPDDGKSTVSTGMAATAARDGLRVLLLDVDTHRGGASRIAGVSHPEWRIEDLLEGRVTVHDVVQRVDGFGHLDVIAFGDRTRWTRGVLTGFAERISPRLREGYDLVVVDSPPVLATSDALRFGILADEALIVVRAGKTTERALRMAVETIGHSGLPLIGTVVNDLEPSRFRRQNQAGGYVTY